MIFCGDVAVSTEDRFCYTGFPQAVLDVPWCLNLEGPVPQKEQTPHWGLCNSISWKNSFENFCLGPVFIGNNHIQDLPSGIEATRESLRAEGLSAFGAGANLAEAGQSVECASGDRRYILIGAGWAVVGCSSASRRRAGVNPLDGPALRRHVSRILRQDPTAEVVVVLHWNYEFELYPQPGHRKLALDLIDDGARAVVGHHPHVVSPVERYKGRTIAYSLGNWAFSYGKYFKGKLKFPKSSFRQLALQIGQNGDTVHHVRFVPPNEVIYSHKEIVGASNFSLAPRFEGFTHQEYLKWFRANRIKKRGLPVYRDYGTGWLNRSKDKWVYFRQALIDAASKNGLKSLRRNDVS